jgi:hypothetical protein
MQLQVQEQNNIFATVASWTSKHTFLIAQQKFMGRSN